MTLSLCAVCDVPQDSKFHFHHPFSPALIQLVIYWFSSNPMVILNLHPAKAVIIYFKMTRIPLNPSYIPRPIPYDILFASFQANDNPAVDTVT
jgi:hypothetical protein